MLNQKLSKNAKTSTDIVTKLMPNDVQLPTKAMVAIVSALLAGTVLGQFQGQTATAPGPGAATPGFGQATWGRRTDPSSAGLSCACFCNLRHAPLTLSTPLASFFSPSLSLPFQAASVLDSLRALSMQILILREVIIKCIVRLYSF